MKILDKKKWTTVFIVLAVLAVIARPSDMLISSLIYYANSTFGTVFYKIMPALAFVMCSFSSAIMLTCRNTMATRSRNRALNVLFVFMTFGFAFAAAYYPFFGAKGTSLIIIAAISAVIAVSAIITSGKAFENTYQKIIMTDFAEKVIVTVLIISAVCAVTLLIPQRLNYDSMMLNTTISGKKEIGPYQTKIPFIPFATASAPSFLFIALIREAVPKLRFKEKLLKVLPFIWTALIAVGSVVTGKVFLSEAIYGAAIGFIAVLLVSKIFEKEAKS